MKTPGISCTRNAAAAAPAGAGGGGPEAGQSGAARRETRAAGTVESQGAARAAARALREQNWRVLARLARAQDQQHAELMLWILCRRESA
jgi:hypothetical protein